MRLDEVRRWASGRGIRATRFRRVRDAALLHVISRLLQAIYRESRAARLSQDERGRWHLDVGRGPPLRAPASGPLPFRRLEIIGRPWVRRADNVRHLRTPGAFLAALRRCLARTEYSRVFDALRADFENSVANVVLNRLIGTSLSRRARAIEPAYQGHQYYPFPALRVGPSLAQVLACSHLSREPIPLPLLELGHCRLVTGAFASYAALFRAWSGLEADARCGPLLPLHPWQLALSPVLRELSDCLSRHTVKAIPLASQRTCRIVQTGFDVKLPVDATLTGEHRLLYGLNCANAPLVSALARHILGQSGLQVLDFQSDVAAMFHPQPALAPHLSAIVRAPVPVRRGEVVVPAINLWSGRHEARRFLQAARIEEFFERYCAALMTGPIEFCAQWGMAFEPHLQNVYVAFRGGHPAGIVLRDLDNSILEPRRIQPLLRELGAQPAPDTWRHMPRFETGGKRLVQAMLFGHLGEVMARLALDHGARTEKLVAIVEDRWTDLAARAPSRSARDAVRKLRGCSDAVKATLRTRLRRANTVEFVRE